MGPKRPQRDRLPLDIANFNDQEFGATKNTEPRTNVFGSAWLTTLDPGKELPLLKWGQIVDFVPMHNSYRVQGEQGTLYICTFASSTGHSIFGVRQGHTLPLGSNVWFVPPIQGHYGTIVCVDPGYITDGRNLRNDFIVQAGRTGLFVDSAHDAPLTKLQYQGGNACFNGGRPVDSTGLGEVNYMTETGLGFHMDSFLTYLRGDESAGLFIWYADQFVRLAAYNYQFRSALGEREELDDQQEPIMFGGQNPYIWETMGAWDWCQENFIEIDPTLAQTTQQEYTLLEPKFDDQQPFHRYQEFGGYLGQAHKRMVVLPPNPLPSQVNRYSSQLKYLGVFNEQISLDGTYLLQARRVGIFKTCGIPVPKMMIRPEDERGDNETNYKAAGKFGPDDGEEHKLQGQFSGANTPRELVNAASVLDMSAFLSNWMSVHPFFYHRQDWYLPEICDTSLGIMHEPISFCALRTDQNLSAPAATIIAVDHKTTASYYPNQSYLVFLEDGGVVAGDGFGGELKMTAGNIEISAPGDINIRPGRSFNVFAGWDANIRANNSADIVANRGDVRLKAENNLQILAGNNEQGGVLIESRATCAAYDFSDTGQLAKHTGIMLVSDSAPITMSGSDVMLQAAPNDSLGSGNIVLSTTKDIKSYASSMVSYINSRIEFFTGTSATNEYWPAQTLISGDLRVAKNVYINKSLAVGDWISVINGHIATTKAEENFGMVAKVSDAAVIQAELTKTTDRQAYLETRKPLLNKPEYENEVLESTTGEAFFSLRDVRDYHSEDYIMFESRWQQQARLTNSVPSYWTENVVMSGGEETYPYPGKEVLLGNSYGKQDLNLFSSQLGSPIDRENNQEDYEEPEFGETTLTVLNGSYPIIRNC